jgi:hypothetical protein
MTVSSLGRMSSQQPEASRTEPAFEEHVTNGIDFSSFLIGALPQEQVAIL